MSGSVNKVILVGNLGADPEIRRTQDGRPIVNMNIATSESWRDRTSGERRERTEWHRVVVFSEGLAKVCEQYLKKGMKVYIEGQLQTRKWQDQQGQDRYTTEIVLQGFNSTLTMLDSPRGGESFGGGDDFAPPAPGGRGGFDRGAGGGRSGGGRPQGGSSGGSAGGPPSGPSGGFGGGDLDDEIPF